MGEEYLWQSKDWQGALTAAASVAGDRLEQVVRQQAQALSAVTATLQACSARKHGCFPLAVMQHSELHLSDHG